jgi:hypothetical protein
MKTIIMQYIPLHPLRLINLLRNGISNMKIIKYLQCKTSTNIVESFMGEMEKLICDNIDKHSSVRVTYKRGFGG